MRTRQNYQIDLTRLQNFPLRAFLTLQPTEALNVSVESASTDKPVKIIGSIDKSWEIAGPLVNLKIDTILLTDDAGATPPIIEITGLKGRVRLAENDISLSADPTRSFSTCFFSQEPFSKENVKELLSKFELKDSIEYTFFQNFTKNEEEFNFSLQVSWFRGYLRSEHAVLATLDDFKIPGFNLAIIKPEFRYTLTTTKALNEGQQESVSFSGNLSHTGNKEFDHDLVGTIAGGDESVILFSVFAQPLQEVKSLELLDWLDILGSEHVGQDVLDVFPFLNNIYFNHLAGSIDPVRKQIRTFEFESTIQLGTTEFSLTYLHPANTLQLELNSETPIKMNEIVGNELNRTRIFPADASIDQLALNYAFDDHSFSLVIDMQDAWSFQFGKTPLVVKGLFFELHKDENGIGGQVAGSLAIGKLDLVLSATRNNTPDDLGWEFKTEFVHEVDIDLAYLLDELAELFHFEKPVNVPDVRIAHLDMSFHTYTHDFQLDLGVTIKEKAIGPIKEGGFGLSINLKKNDDGSHHFVMDLAGTLTVSDVGLSINALNIGQADWSFELELKKESETKGLDLLQLAQFVNLGQPVKLGVDFPEEIKNLLVVDNLHFKYQHGSDETNSSSFNVSAVTGTNSKMGVLLAGNRSAGEDSKWNFIFGGFFESKSDITTKPEIPVEVKDIWLLYSTNGEKGGSWPTFPAEFPHSLVDHDLKKGILVAATLDLHGKHDNISGISRMKGAWSKSEISVLVEYTSGPVSLLMMAMLEGTVNIPTGQGHHLVLKNVALSIHAPNPSLSLQGEVDVMIDNHPVLMTGGFDINSSGIDTRLKIDFEKGGISLFGLKDVRIDDFSVELGIDFVPPGVRFGVMCDIEFGKQKKPNQLGILLEFDGPVPNPEYLAIDIPELDLSELLNQFAGSSAHGHAQVKDSLAEMSDVSLVWAEKSVVLPDGKTATPGFSFHGGIKIMNWGAYVALDIHPQTGISGGGEFSPIHLGPLSITGTGNGMFVKETWTGTEWKRVSNAQINSGRSEAVIDLKDPQKGAEREFQLVSPGGAVLLFNSAGSPYLEMGVRLDLFNIKLGELEIKLTSDELYFFFFIQIPGIARFKLECDLFKSATNPHFKIDGSFFLGLDIHFEVLVIQVKIKLGINADMFIAMDPETGFELKIDGGFNFFGHKVSAEILNIHVAPKGLENISKWILDHIVENVLPGFKKKIHDGSGAGDEDRYSDEKWMHATDLLVQAREWASFVHRDMEQLMHQKNLSTEQIEILTAKINDEADKIFKNNAHTVNINTATSNEAKAMMVILEKTKTALKDGSMDSARERRAAEILRMEKEMREIEDRNHELKNEILKIWDNHEVKLRVKSENLRRVQEEVAGQISDIKRIAEDQRIINAEKELQDVIDRIEDQIKQLYGGMIALRPKDDEPIPLIPVTLYSRVAVEHHAFIIRNQRDAHERERTILETARAHSRAIADAAHNDEFNLIKPEP